MLPNLSHLEVRRLVYIRRWMDSFWMQNLFIVAKRFYLLFQQHTTKEFNEQRQEFFGEMG